MKFAICVGCWTPLESHGYRPYRIDDQANDEDEDEATKRQIDEEIRKSNEPMFKDTVHEAQENAENQSQFGFDASEVDYGEEDEEMKEEDEEVDVEIEIDEPEGDDDEVDAQQEAADRQTEEKTKALPSWAMNLEAGTKKMPIKGLQNIAMYPRMQRSSLTMR